MRPYTALTASLFSKTLLALRSQKGLTQEKMAEQLRITSRAYSDLEHGKYGVSASTLLFLLSMMTPDEQHALLEQFKKEVQLLEDRDAA